MPSGPIFASSPAVWRGRVYVASFAAAPDSYLNVFDADGCGEVACDPLWLGTGGHYLNSSPAVAYGRVYVGSGDGTMLVYPARGCGGPRCGPSWFGDTAGPVATSESAPMVANSVVYIGENNGRVYAYNAEGCGQFECDGRCSSSPTTRSSTPPRPWSTGRSTSPERTSAPCRCCTSSSPPAAEAAPGRARVGSGARGAGSGVPAPASLPARTLAGMSVFRGRLAVAALAAAAALSPGNSGAAVQTGTGPLGPPESATVAGASTARNLVRVDFDEITAPDGTPISTITVSGAADVVAAVARRNGGEVRAATARPGQGRAVRLPGFDPDETGPRAVLRITNAGSPDRLDPGTRNFSFGADFVLDAISAEPGTADDGDNLVQRGLYEDPDQYKLQLDGRHPSCRLKGATLSGTASVEVSSSVEVDSSHWYRARCVRTGLDLDVVVTRYELDGTSQRTRTRVSSAAVIDVHMNSARIPLSIGGKLNADGTVNVDSDQLNGLVDNAVLRIR